MHDVAGHIHNLFEEIPNHMLKPDNRKVNNSLEKLKKVIELSMEKKEVKRCVDYRCGLLKVTHYMKDKFSRENKDMQLLLETHWQKHRHIVCIRERPRNILRLYNLPFVHAIMCQSVFGKKIKAMTTSKFYRKYYHQITTRAPFQYRLIS